MWSNKYIGIPFKERGRDFSGIDCWGLVRLIYKDEFNIILPSFVDDYTTTDDTARLEELIAQYREGWDQITALEPGAVILFKLLGSESHIAVAINDKQFIHVSEGSTSAIESIDSILWNKRIVGYFKYNSSKNVVLNTIPHPLKTERYTLPITPGTTLQQLHSFVIDKWNVAPELKSYANILVNGRPISVERWDTFVLKDTDVVEYRAVPGKDVVRLALFIALVIYAPQIAGALEPTLIAATSGGSIAGTFAANWAMGTVGSTFATMAVTIVGGALINAIAPIRPPKVNDPGQTESQYMVTGGANQANPYGSIPVILGKVRMTPALGAQSYATFLNERDSYLTMLLVWGYGPLVIDATTYKIGEVALDLGQNTQAYQFAKFDSPDQTQDMFITLDRQNDVADADKISKFNTIYSSDVYQNLVNLTLAGAEDLTDPANPKKYSPEQNAQTQTQTTTHYVAYSEDSSYGEDLTVIINPIPSGAWVSTSNNGDKVNTMVVDIHFPEGLSRISTKDGSREPAFVNIAVEYKIDNGSWTSWIDPYIEYTGGKSMGGKIAPSAAKKDAFTISYEKNFPQGTPTGTITIRARRENGDDPDFVPEYRYSHTVTFLAATFYRTASNNEALQDPRNCKLAKTALRIKSTNQINGQLDGISAIVNNWLYRYNGTSWSYGISSNPADLFRYVLQHPANPQRVTDSQLDLTQIEYWWNYCNTTRTITYTDAFDNVNTSVSFKFEYNNIIGETRSVMDILRDICAAGRASPTLINGKWSVTIDEPKNTIVQHFTPHNSWGFEGIRALPKLPDALRINFLDETNNYQQSEIIVYKAGKNSSNAELFESIQLPGVTKAASVVDHAKWHMAQAYVRREVYSINADLEYLVCNRGDRVVVMHDIPMWGLGSGRIKNKLTSQVIELDESVAIDSQQNHTVRIRSKTGTSNTWEVEKQFNIISASSISNTVTITTSTEHNLSVGDFVEVILPAYGFTATNAEVLSVNNTYTQFTFKLQTLDFPTTNVSGTVILKTGYYKRIKLNSTSTTSQADVGDLFLFGYLNQESQDLIVISIEPTSNKSARLTLVDYGVTDSYNIFTDYATTITSDTVFEAQISKAPELNRNLYTSTQKPIITLISSDETAGDLISPNVIEDRIKVAFGHPADLPTNTAAVECEYDYSTSTSTTTVKSIRANYPSNTIYIPNVRKGEVYKIRVRYIANNGVVGLWTNFVLHTVVGRVRELPNVENLAYILNELNIELSWSTPTNNFDYDKTELRYVTSAVPNVTETTQQKIALWDSSTLIGYSNTGKFNWIKPATNNYRILAKHKGKSNNYSVVPRIANVTWTNLILASITSDLSNPRPLILYNDSNQPILTGTGTTITVKQGGTILKYDGVGTSNGTWKVTKQDGANITSGAIVAVQNAQTGDNYATIGDLSTFTATTSSIVTYTITGKSTFGDSFTITEIHTYSKLASGKSSALVFAYQRAATNTTWTDWPNQGTPGEITFNLNTFQITTGSLSNNWSKEIYDDATGSPLWVTVATASSSATTDTIASNEWSTPVIYANNGLNTATIALYKRTSTTTVPTAAKPTASLKYTFSSGSIDKWNSADTLTTILNGWETTIPTYSGKYLWVIYATAANTAATDEIEVSQWATPAILTQDGLSAPLVKLTGTGLAFVEQANGNGIYPDKYVWTANTTNILNPVYTWYFGKDTNNNLLPVRNNVTGTLSVNTPNTTATISAISTAGLVVGMVIEKVSGTATLGTLTTITNVTANQITISSNSTIVAGTLVFNAGGIKITDNTIEISKVTWNGITTPAEKSLRVEVAGTDITNLYDQETLFYLREGSDALAMALINETQPININRFGQITSPTNIESQVIVARGTDLVNTNITYSYVANSAVGITENNITITNTGAISFPSSSVTQTTASAIFKATVTNANGTITELTKKLTVYKVLDGPKGDKGDTPVEGIDYVVSQPAAPQLPKKALSTYLYYQSASATTPNAPTKPSEISYTFSTNALASPPYTGTNTAASRWLLTPPTFTAGSTNNYWYISFSATSNDYGGDTASGSNIVLGTPQQGIGFTGLVTYTALGGQEGGTTFIDGGKIITDTINASRLKIGNLNRSGNRIELTDDVLKVYDNNNIARVILGKLT